MCRKEILLFQELSNSVPGSTKNWITSWLFQLIWKILVKLDHFRVKIKNIWNHQPDHPPSKASFIPFEKHEKEFEKNCSEIALHKYI